MDTVSTIIPVGLAISYIKSAAGGTHIAVGEAKIELSISNSMNGKLLLSAVDARTGTKAFKGKFDNWSHVKDAFEYWSKEINRELVSFGAGI